MGNDYNTVLHANDPRLISNNPVQLCFVFLDGCNVSIAPASTTLIGSSHHEERLSKKAIRDVFWEGKNSQVAANLVSSIRFETNWLDYITGKFSTAKNMSLEDFYADGVKSHPGVETFYVTRHDLSRVEKC